MPAKRIAFLLVLLSGLTAVAYAQAPGVYALEGGTVHPASGPAITNGIVIIRGGLVEAVGASVPVPPDAAVIDLAGAHVYPGLIDAQTSVGFAAPRPVARRRGGAGSRTPAPSEPIPETSPAFVAMRSVKLTDDDLDDRRSTGVTTIVTAPSFGIFNGQSAMLNLGEGDVDSRVVKAPASMQISFNPRPAWTFPDSLMGVIADIRQTMYDAQHYRVAHAIYDKNPAGVKRPETSEALEALEPVLDRTEPVVFIADSDLMMLRAQRIASEFNLRYILSGVRQGYKMPHQLKSAGAPLLVSVKWPTPPASKEDREEQPLRVIRDRQLEPTTPAVLAKEGVEFALVSGAGKAGDFIPGIRKAIDHGLSADDALRATTLWPAQIFGVDRQLGSIDRGKIANLVVTDKPIFEKDAKVTRLFVDGREMRLPPPEKRPKESEKSPIDGAWNLTVRSSPGDVAIHVTLHAEDGRVSGAFSGDKGSGDIRDGSFDGADVEFMISVRGQQENESGDWVFHGTVTGDSMQGTVTTNLGSFAFSGSKSR